MTTSPFGAPSQFGGTATMERDAAPDTSAGTSAPQTEEKAPRGKLLYVLLGLVLLAALGAGAYFLFFTGGTEDEGTASVPPATAPVEQADPVEPVVPVSQWDTLAGRNPFASQVVEGGEAAAPTAPVVTAPAVAAPSTSTSSGSTSGTAGSTAGAAGVDGADGVDGQDGAPGQRGASGANGVSPAWVTITLRDVVDDATPDPKGTFTVRDAAGEVSTPNVVVDYEIAQVGDTAPKAVSVVSFEDPDGDGEMDYAVVQVGEAGAQYSVWIGEALPLFGY